MEKEVGVVEVDGRSDVGGDWSWESWGTEHRC